MDNVTGFEKPYFGPLDSWKLQQSTFQQQDQAQDLLGVFQQVVLLRAPGMQFHQ
jgi:hypothetical protein